MHRERLVDLAPRRRGLFRRGPRLRSHGRRLEPPLRSPRLRPTSAPPGVAAGGAARGMRPLRWAAMTAAIFCTSAWPGELGVTEATPQQLWGVAREHISRAIAHSVASGQVSPTVRIDTGRRGYAAVLEYTFDAKIQRAIDELLQRYQPDYGAFVAIEPDSGRVLAIASHSQDAENWGNLALRASFPAASVFKIITAAAAIEEGKASATTVIAYNGKSTSLYKSQVLRHQDNKWTRRIPLSRAFAKSVNPVFGRLGVFYVGGDKLHEYAARFGFNQAMSSDIDLRTGSTAIDTADQWSVAEAASGYTRTNTLSPLHGAMVAAAVVNGGLIVQPFVVDAAYDENGVLLYAAGNAAVNRAISEDTAAQMRVLMRETVRSGSARKSFNRFFKGHLADVEVGGKTGSLTGLTPRGKNDWFVGYAAQDERRIAFAALTVNKERWRVKSAYLARKVIEVYFEPRTGNST